MTSPSPRARAKELNAAKRAFNGARKQLELSLFRVNQSLAAFKQAAGDRQSAMVLEQSLLAAGKDVKPPGIPSGAAALTESLLWLQELQRTALADQIIEDLELEAQESETEHASRLVVALHELDRSVEDYREAHTGIAAHLQKKDAVMSNGDRQRTPPIQVRVTTDGSTGAAATKVQKQLIATLDSLGMPHRDGLLDVRGPDAPRLADRLVEALGRRFEVGDDPVMGLRAEARRYSIYERGGASGDELAGRIAIAADLATATCRQMEVTLDDFLGLAQSIDEWPMNEPAKIDSARVRVASQLAVLGELAGRPGGPPASRCGYELDMLKQALAQQLYVLGLDRSLLDPNLGWQQLREGLKKSFGGELPDLPATIQDQLEGLADQLFDQATTLNDQLVDHGNKLVRSEASYHLRRILEAIATQVEATRADMEESPESAAWVGALLDSRPPPGRYLADELDEALNWLEELATSYGLSDGGYQEMRPAAVGKLAGALGQLQTMIGTCRKALTDLDVPDDDDVVERLTGLLKLITSAQSLASGLHGEQSRTSKKKATSNPRRNPNRAEA